MKFINGEWVADNNSVEEISLRNIKQRTKIIKTVKIKQENRQNQYYAYSYDLVEHIKVMMEADDFNNLVFRNKNEISYHRSKKQISCGYAYLDDIIQNGFHEYKSVEIVWVRNGYNPYRAMTGKQAVWAIILHEFAHHFQTDGPYGESHNDDFRNKLNELIILFPFAEVENLK